MLNKKAISPVVATALLLVVAVTSAIGFQIWFNTYSSSVFTNVETKSPTNSVIKAEGIVGNILYIKTDYTNEFNNFKITDSNSNTMCEIKNNVKEQLETDTQLLLNFDDGTATDLSNNGNNGALNGGVDCSIKGISNNGCQFDATDDYITISNDNSLNPKEQITLSTWVYFNSLSSTQYFFEKPFTSGAEPYHQYSLLAVTNGSVAFSLSLDGTRNDFFSTTTVAQGKWYHIISTYDGSIMKIYIDGQKDTNELIASGNITEYNTPVELGRYLGLHYFNGRLDDVAIYSKALTAQQVKDLYNSQKMKFYEQNSSQKIKEIDISTCNLTKGEAYNIIGFTDSQKIEQTVIKR